MNDNEWNDTGIFVVIGILLFLIVIGVGILIFLGYHCLA